MKYFFGSFHFFSIRSGAKEIIHMNKNLSTSAQKIDLFREFNASIFGNFIKTTNIYICATSEGRGHITNFALKAHSQV